MIMEKVNIEKLKGLKALPDEVEVRKYVPIKEKIAYAKVLSGMVIKRDEYDVAYADTVAYKIAVIVGTVGLYTNIELLDDNYECYDILVENGLIEDVKNTIGIDCEDFAECIKDFVDIKVNTENDINHVVARKADDVMIIFNRTMKHVEGMLDKGDPNKIAKYLSKGIEALAAKMPDFSQLDVFESLKGKKMN